ncbi:heavy-metal-associated domain-containing protein [Enterococcus faecalis]
MEKTVKIEGMKCDGCVQTVTEKFSQIEGVTAVDVRLETKSATVTTNREVSNEELNKTLNDTKFSVAN